MQSSTSLGIALARGHYLTSILLFKEPKMAIPSTTARDQYIDMGENLDVVQVLGPGGAVLTGQTVTGFFYGTKMASDNLTATPGGTQGNSILITTPISRFSTVATLNDSATLPPGLRGMEITIINDGAQSMKVFPALGEQINNAAANTGFTPLAAGTPVLFFCTSNGQWHTK